MYKRQSEEFSGNAQKKKALPTSRINSADSVFAVPKNPNESTTSALNDNSRHFDDNTQFFHSQFIRKIDEAVRLAPCRQPVVPATSVTAPKQILYQLSHCFGFSQDIESQLDETITPAQRYTPPPTQELPDTQQNHAERHEWADSLDNSVLFQIDDSLVAVEENELNNAKLLLDDDQDELLGNIEDIQPQSSQRFLNDVKQFVAEIEKIDNDASIMLTGSQWSQIDNANFARYKSNGTMNEYLALQRSMHEENAQNVHNDDFDMERLNDAVQLHQRVENTFNECERTIRGLARHTDMEESDEFASDIAGNENFNLSEFKDEFEKTYAEETNKPDQSLQNVRSIKTPTRPTLPVSTALFSHLGPFFGLPDKVRALIKEYKGIGELYDWQIECLRLPAIEQRNNLIYALPTSGGKTLVSEILILREILCRQRNCLFILPYVSIVQEKMWTLSPFAVHLDFLIEEYAGGKGCLPPRRRRKKKSIYIATIEKGLAMFDSLIEVNRANEIGLVVVDELHILGEGSRGAVLESLLTKIQYIKAGIQIVGMSATIGNINELATFLNADVYNKDFRPVELREHIKCGSDVLEIRKNTADIEEAFVPVRTVDFNYNEEVLKIDPDHITGLVAEVIPGSSCLVFCPTKKNCENVAILLRQILSKKYIDHKSVEKQELMKAIEVDTGNPLCPILAKTLPYGVAYHHSGLTVDERRHLENAFRDNIICVICCTSTLAAGVNLPAKRVIIRSPYVGRDFITLSRYKQMVGRAGRAGYGEAGDSILICAARDNTQVMSLLCSPMEQVSSYMHEENARALRALFLSAIGLGLANCRKELLQLASTTLAKVQADRLGIDMVEISKSVIKNLIMSKVVTIKMIQKSNESIKIDNVELVSQDSNINRANTQISQEVDNTAVANNSTKPTRNVVLKPSTPLEISRLGRASFKSGIDLDRSEAVYKELLQARMSLVVVDYLHLLYLVTPYDASESQVRPDKRIFYQKYCNLTPNQHHTAKIIGISESIALKIVSGKSIKSDQEFIVNKFYVTLMLNDLWNLKSASDIAQSFQVERGFVQNLMTIASINASSIQKFCEEVDDLWCFRELLLNFIQRLAYCCSMELLPLMQLPSVKLARAKQLFNGGFKSLEDVAGALAQDLVSKVEHLNMKVAKQLISAAKVLLLERVETLREEAQDCLDILVKKTS